MVFITLVGSASIACSSGPGIPLSSSQVQLVVARLVLERHSGTARDALADMLWPAELPPTWASALRSLVTRARQFLLPASINPETTIVAHGGRYVVTLRDDLDVDLEVAERSLQLALSCLENGDHEAAVRHADHTAKLARVPFFPTQDGEWVAMVRDRAEETCLGALEIASSAATALGYYEHALATADEAARRAPHRESAHRCRMAAHGRAGNRAEALRAYSRLRRILAEELGVDPSEETENAYIELLSVPSTANGAHGNVTHRGSAGNSPFVGRDTEVSELLNQWQQLSTTGLRLSIIDGPSGIGKTRLVTEVAGEIRKTGGSVLLGRCDRNSIVAFQPIIEALQGYVTSTPADLQPDVAGRVRSIVESAIHDLDISNEVIASPDNPGSRLLAIGDFIFELVRNTPTMIILDDVDVAHSATVEALRHIMIRCEDQPLWVVATSGVPAPALCRKLVALHSLDFDQRCTSITLEELNSDDIATLTARFGERATGLDLERLQRDSGGNPYIAIEIASARQHHPSNGVPQSIHEYVASRLIDVPEALRNVLSVAATVGETFELDIVAHAAGFETAAPHGLCRLLSSTGLVLEDALATTPTQVTMMRFVQGVVPRAIVAQLSDERRRSIHSDVAASLATLRIDRLDACAASIAYHHRASAGDVVDGKAVEWSWRAAEHALKLEQPNNAVGLLRRALGDIPNTDDELKAETLTSLGLAELAAGEAHPERSLIDGATLAASIGRSDIMSRAALGVCQAARGRPDLRSDAIALASDVVISSVPDDSDPHLSLTLARLAAQLVGLGGRVATRGMLITAGERLERELDRLTGLADSLPRGMIGTELLTIGERLDDPGFRFTGAYHGSMAAAYDADESGVDTLSSRLETNDGTGDLLLAERSVVNASIRGMMIDAAALSQFACPPRPFDHSSPLSAHVHQPASVAHLSLDHRIEPSAGSYCLRQLDVVDWLLGRRLGVSHRPNDRKRERLMDGNVTVDGAMLALRRGDRGRARIRARALANGFSELPDGDDWPHAIAVLALAAVELADQQAAGTLYETLERYDSKTLGCGFRSYVGPAAFHLGRLAVVLGEWDRADDHLAAARIAAVSRAARPWVAHCDLSTADVIERRGRLGERSLIEPLRSSAAVMLSSLGVMSH
jgi:DNA-binding SARP family transcriptional activator